MLRLISRSVARRFRDSNLVASAARRLSVPAQTPSILAYTLVLALLGGCKPEPTYDNPCDPQSGGQCGAAGGLGGQGGAAGGLGGQGGGSPGTSAAASTGYVRINPGRFEMGSPADEELRYDNETQHEVVLTRAFLMKTTEVTQAEWSSVMGTNPSAHSGCSNCPVEQVSWDDAVEYLNELSSRDGLQACYSGDGIFSGLDCTGYRLPTEAEWEYAARATTRGPGYGDLDEVAWYDENSGFETHPTGTKAKNAWGLYDMIGNVWEWTGDWYSEYPSGKVTDPAGPPSGGDRVSRGGGWRNVARNARSANRGDYAPGRRSDYLGFRAVRTVR